LDNARWLAGAFVCMLASSFGQTFFISLSSGDLRRELSLGHGEFGWVYTAATLGSALLLPYAGKLIDQVHLSRYAALVVAGLAGSMALLGAATNLPTLFVALLGLRLTGQGLLGHTAMTAIGRWFTLERGRAASTAALGIQLGEGLLPFSFVALATAVGWRQTWWLGAGACALLVLPLVTWLVHAPRVPPESETHHREPTRSWTRADVLRDPLFYTLMLGILAGPVIGTTVFFHQVHLTDVRGWPLGHFAAGTPLLALTAMGSTVVAGFLIDRFGAMRLVPTASACLALAVLALGLVDSPRVIPVFMAGVGAAFGLSAAISGTLWPELYGTPHLGAIRSAVTALVVLSTAIGPGVSGMLIDQGVPLPDMIAALGLYALAMVPAMAVVARWARARESGSASH
jgi:MFS family permease